MGWKEVKRRISEPITTPEIIKEILKSCLKESSLRGNLGNNRKHSASIRMNDYISPQHGKENISKEEIDKVKYDLIRYMASSLLKECKPEDTDKSIAKFIKGWEEKNPKIDITVKELLEIAHLSDEDIEKSLKVENKKSNIQEFIHSVHNSINIGEDNTTHTGDNPIYPFEKTAYSKRIYFNSPRRNINTYKFLSEYIKKCIDRRIPFQMKAFGSDEHQESELDGTVLYSDNNFFDEHLDVVEEVIKENPEIMSSFGSPIYTGARVKEDNGESYYAISAGKPENGSASYNKHIDKVINSTYLITSAKLVKQYFPVIAKEYRELGEDTKKIIEQLNILEGYSALEIKNIALGSRLEHRETIRELAYRIITYKRENSSQLENEEIMDKMRITFSNNLKMMSSILKFGDKEHLRVPVYKDESFLNFERQISSRDIAEADKTATLSTSEVYEAKNIIGKMVGKDDKKQEI